jgi:hypothetical protein
VGGPRSLMNTLKTTLSVPVPTRQQSRDLDLSKALWLQVATQRELTPPQIVPASSL